MTFRFALQATGGRPDYVRSYRFGQDSTNRMLAQVIRGSDNGELAPHRSWFGLQPEHVAVVGMKRAENRRGWIVRLLELGVSDCVATLTWQEGESFQPLACDSTERNQRILARVMNGSGDAVAVRVAMRKGELATVRLIPEPVE